MTYPLLALQQTVFTLLNGDASLQNLVNGIYDQPPPDAVYPFIAIKQVKSRDWSFQGGQGIQAEFELHIYSRYHGKGECYGIMERMHTILHASSPSVDGGPHFASIRFTDSEIETLRDGRSIRGTMHLSIYAHDS